MREGHSVTQSGSASPYNCKFSHIVQCIAQIIRCIGWTGANHRLFQYIGQLKSKINIYRRKMKNLLSNVLSEARPLVEWCLVSDGIYPFSRSSSYSAHSERTFCGYAQPFPLRSSKTKWALCCSKAKCKFISFRDEHWQNCKRQVKETKLNCSVLLSPDLLDSEQRRQNHALIERQTGRNLQNHIN